MSKYMEILGATATETVPPVRTAAGVTNLATRASQSPLFDPTKAPITMKDLAFSVLGGLGGAMLWKKHRVLGFLGGVAVGSSVEPMMRGAGSDRSDVAYRLGIVGAGVGTALYFGGKSNTGRAVGYAGGALGATLLTAYANGSPMNRMAKRIEAEKAAA